MRMPVAIAVQTRKTKAETKTTTANETLSESRESIFVAMLRFCYCFLVYSLRQRYGQIVVFVKRVFIVTSPKPRATRALNILLTFYAWFR